MNIVYTGKFKKDAKRLIKQHKSLDKLYEIVEKLSNGELLPPKNKDHPLIGKWQSRRDCHIEPNWILIYCIKGDDLILERTGSHSDLFK